MKPQLDKPETRNKVRIAIFYYGKNKKVLISDYSINMSTGGVFIETNNIMPEDTPLIVRFKLLDSDIIINCNARVAWINKPGNIRKQSLPPGMGLQFLDLSLGEMHAIKGYLNSGNLVPIW